MGAVASVVAKTSTPHIAYPFVALVLFVFLEMTKVVKFTTKNMYWLAWAVLFFGNYIIGLLTSYWSTKKACDKEDWGTNATSALSPAITSSLQILVSALVLPLFLGIGKMIPKYGTMIEQAETAVNSIGVGTIVFFFMFSMVFSYIGAMIGNTVSVKSVCKDLPINED